MVLKQFTRPTPFPLVVAGSGLGGVKEMLLPEFAPPLNQAGIALFIFDFIGFGASGGARRQYMDPESQVEEYRAAIEFAASQPQIAPDRLGVWGPSMSGGHVLKLAAIEPAIRAAVALIPFVSFDSGPIDQRLVDAAVQAIQSDEAGGPPRMIPLAGKPGDLAVMTNDGAYEWIQEISRSAPTFRNELVLSSLVNVASYKPARDASKISKPLRVVLATNDTITPAAAVRAALAGLSGIDYVEFPETHFEVFGKHLNEVTASTVQLFQEHL